MGTTERPFTALDRLGVKRVINGQSWVTALGGSIMPPEVQRAMAETANCFVDMVDLNRKAGEVIARLTGAEAGMVTAGASAGVVLQVAACMTGGDDVKMAQLPDPTGMKDEVIIHRAHRNHYDSAYRIPGAKLIEIGRFRETAAWQLEAAISERTAAVAYAFSPFLGRGLPLDQVIDIAHKRGVPVIVDAAAELPPVENLTKFIDMGADMVAFSGGKGLRAPQSTGILCGTRELIDAAFLNTINYRAANAGIGRPMKVCKEEIVGLITALELFVDRDHEAEWRAWRAKADTIVGALQDIPGVDAKVVVEEINRHGPTPVISFERSWKGLPPAEIVDALKQGDSPVYLGFRHDEDEIYITPVCLVDGDEDVIVERLRALLTQQR